MKNFTSLASAQAWCLQVLKVGASDGIAPITEQLYKRSKPYTYYDQHRMYESGEEGAGSGTSFKDGIVVEQTPYVRKRYYEGGKPNSSHPQGQARWWETTKRVYAKEIEQMAVKYINEAKLK